MQLRAAVRYSEYKSADRLPKTIPVNCTECIEADKQDNFNCSGEKTNPKFHVRIGAMEYDQCPLSVPKKEAWDVIELIATWEDTGTPIVGHCLLEQSPQTFVFRRIINSERNDCRKEIQQMIEVENRSKTKTQGQSRGRSNRKLR